MSHRFPLIVLLGLAALGGGIGCQSLDETTRRIYPEYAGGEDGYYATNRRVYLYLADARGALSRAVAATAPTPSAGLPSATHTIDLRQQTILSRFAEQAAQHGRPSFVILASRSLDLGDRLRETIQTIKAAGGQETTIVAETRPQDGRPGERAPRAPAADAAQVSYKQVEASLYTALDHAQCAPLDAGRVWSEAAGERGVPALADLSRQADILIALDVDCQMAQEAGRKAQLLNVAGCAIDLPSGEVLGRYFFCIRRQGPPGLRAFTPNPPPTAPPAFDAWRVELEAKEMACHLMAQIGESWGQGMLYTLTITDLASDAQLQAIRDCLGRVPGLSDIRVMGAVAAPPKSGHAIVQFRTRATPDAVLSGLCAPGRLSGLRLEVSTRRYTRFTLRAIALPPR